MFLFFSVLGFFVFAVFVLLKAAAPRGRDSIFLVAFPGENGKEYLLKLRWLETVLAVTGLKDKITLVAVDEKTEENGFSELEAAFPDRNNVIILKNP